MQKNNFYVSHCFRKTTAVINIHGPFDFIITSFFMYYNLLTLDSGSAVSVVGLALRHVQAYYHLSYPERIR